MTGALAMTTPGDTTILMELKKFHPDLLISEVVTMNERGKAFHLLEEKPDQYLKILVKNQ